jgi:hypothetical protein
MITSVFAANFFALWRRTSQLELIKGDGKKINSKQIHDISKKFSVITWNNKVLTIVLYEKITSELMNHSNNCGHSQLWVY